MKVFIRSFKNQILISRHNCTSTSEIKITGVEGVFLKKKIVELVDIIKHFILQLEDTTSEPRIIVADDTIQ